MTLLLAQGVQTEPSTQSIAASFGTLISGGLAGWGLFKVMFSGKQDFLRSIAYMFTSGLRSTIRGDLLKNLSGTFRFILWLFLTLFALVVGGIFSDRAVAFIAKLAAS